MSTIISEISTLKIDVGKYLAGLETALVQEDKRLAEIRDTITAGEAHLKELHDIEVAADTLALLKKTHDEKNQLFEKVTAERKEQWKQEKETFEQALKEEEAEIKKQRKRNEEEYAYGLKIFRKKEQDAYDEKMAKQKKEFEETTRTKTDELEKREAEKRAADATAARLQMEKVILEKDNERETELLKLRISAQEEKLKEQTARIVQLEKDLKDAVAKTHGIASQVIEGMAGNKPGSGPGYRNLPAAQPLPEQG